MVVSLGWPTRQERTGLATQVDPVALASGLEPVIELVRDAALLVDGDGTVVAANRAAERLFGQERAQLVNRAIDDLVASYERACGDLGSERGGPGDGGRAAGASAGAGSRIRRADVRVVPVLAGSTGLAVAVVRGGTAPGEPEAEALLAAFVQSSPDALVSCTRAGVVTGWNPAAEELFGYRSDEMVGRDLGVLFDEQAAGEFEEVLASILATGRPARVDACWTARDGSRIDVALSLAAIRDAAGEVRGFSAIIRDIADRKRDEAEVRRLFAEERRLRRQHGITAEVRLSLLAGDPMEHTLRTICRHAGDLVEVAAAMVLVHDGGSLEVLAKEGDSALLEAFGPLERDLLRRVAETGGVAGQRLPAGAACPAASVLAAPLASASGVAGALCCLRYGTQWSPDEVAAVSNLADQASVTIELSRTREDRERLMLIGDRDRIARDLHDLVIQRLFASGMRLQSMRPLLRDPDVRERVDAVIDELDATIGEIRTTIFGLSHHFGPRPGLKSEILSLAQQAAGGLGFMPAVRFEGVVDAAVPEEVASHAVAVVSEGLSNAVRHARASRVEVSVQAGEELVVEIGDDGVGIAAAARTSGLGNLHERALALGGSFEVARRPGGGTLLRWRAPLTGKVPDTVQA